jgi:hypothetical protein
MVSLRSLAALAVLPAAALAKIDSFKVPATAAAESTISVELTTSIYIQNWDDFGIVWGIGYPAWKCDGCVGTEIAWTNLHGSDAPTVPAGGKFTVDVKLPASYGPGDYIFHAGIPYLVGASGLTGYTYLESNITLTDKSS